MRRPLIRSSRVADSEQRRADQLAKRIEEIRDHPGSASHDALPHYQAAYQDAASNAAAHTRQPK